jgi:RNA polymerase sigma-54 factor
MALELRQQLKLTQSLVMTPQLQQAIKLLQLSRLELVNVVQQELVENPVLEEVAEEDNGDGAEETTAEAEELVQADAAEAVAAGETPTSPEEKQLAEDLAKVTAESEGEPAPGGEEEPSAAEMVGDVDWESYMESRPQTCLSESGEDRPPVEDSLVRHTSLTDHLVWQLGFVELPEEERHVAELIVGNLDEDGYLDEKLEEIAAAAHVSLDVAERVLRRIQELDPVGVAARSISECLLVQARVRGIADPLVLRVLADHLDLLQRKDLRGIARIESVSVEQVAAAADVIASLEPRPGRAYADEEPIYITPDIFVHKVGDEYHVVLNEDGMPKLRVSAAYRAVLGNKDASAKETRDYVREKLRGAVWLIKSIHQRQRTIVKVMQSILRFQREFFDKGSEHLRPLNLRDVAEDIGMHESTVSRVTTNKYVQTPHGIFELKFFFNSSIATGDGDAIASESVKEKIRDLIRAEDAHHPLSDQAIAEALRTRNIRIARRTVTKYREAMRILSSTQRRRIG